VRVLSATNADLSEEVAQGRFREDLLFRLNTISLNVPPLRERRADIAPLAAHFLGRFVERYGKTLGAAIEGFDEAAIRALLEYRWPGNVRELEHAVERGLLMANGPLITPADLGLHEAAGSRQGPDYEEMTLEAAERLLIERAMRRLDGNVSEVARVLGVSRGALYRRLKSHGL
jgi:DNA-binding NtrC family response regulator